MKKLVDGVKDQVEAEVHQKCQARLAQMEADLKAAMSIDDEGERKKASQRGRAPEEGLLAPPSRETHGCFVARPRNRGVPPSETPKQDGGQPTIAIRAVRPIHGTCVGR